MADFITAYTKYIKPIEGGYVNLSTDKGKETYAGITRKNYPNWVGWPTIDSKKTLYKNGIIPRYTIFSELNSSVQQFYNDLWNKNRFGEIQNQDIANLLFDFFVNSGYDGIKEIQKLVNVTVDGGLGTQTLAAINKSNASQLYLALKQARVDFYNQIIKREPDEIANYNGWIARLGKFPAFIANNALPIGIVVGVFLLVGVFWYSNQESTKKKFTPMSETVVAPETIFCGIHSLKRNYEV